MARDTWHRRPGKQDFRNKYAGDDNGKALKALLKDPDRCRSEVYKSFMAVTDEDARWTPEQARLLDRLMDSLWGQQCLNVALMDEILALKLRIERLENPAYDPGKHDLAESNVHG